MKGNLFIRFWKFKGFVLLSLLIILCVSCQKEEPQVNPLSGTNDGISFYNGRLIFRDVTSFIDHQKWLFENQGNPQLIANKNNSLGLKSMTEYYLEGMKLEETDPLFLTYVDRYPNIFNKVDYDNSTLYLLPHSKLLCYIANKDGIYQVGDYIHRISGDYIYQINDGDESKIEMLFLPLDQIPTKDIKIIPSHSNDSKSDYAQRTRYFTINNNFRIVSSLREYTNGIAWWDDIRTNPQHKVGFWFRAQLNTKSANGNGYFAFCSGCTQTPIYPDYDEGTGLTQDVIAFYGGSNINMSASFCPAYSRGELQGEYIYVYWPDALNYNPSYTEPDWIPGINEPF